MRVIFDNFIFAIKKMEQFKICKTCTKRQLNLQTGLYCGLTNEKPNFIGSCKDYTPDEAIIEIQEFKASPKKNSNLILLYKEMPVFTKIYSIVIFTIPLFVLAYWMVFTFDLFNNRNIEMLLGISVIGSFPLAIIIIAFKDLINNNYEHINLIRKGFGLLIVSGIINLLLIIIFIATKEMDKENFHSLHNTELILSLMLLLAFQFSIVLIFPISINRIVRLIRSVREVH
ncbi:MAG: hypothetical protein ABJH72_20200 [Reichenbachiella sp.]|uniref:hypothetical protein n=2 Tax=Reichenbachiella sp. TaxID=2184521 RepID=UPI0032645690